MFQDIDRLFVFGCSFSQWGTPTWADILATHLNIEYYNYASGGAGNQFIFTKLQQADIHYKFTHKDLVIVQWTNIRREDRFFERDDKWITPGNIYNQNLYNDNYVDNYVNDSNSALRDYTLIYAASQMLHHKTNFKFLQMVDIFETLDQWDEDASMSPVLQSIIDFYKPHIKPLLPESFYQILWDNDMENKRQSVKTEFHPDYNDYHPSILEHGNFVKQVFDLQFSDDLWDSVINADQYFKNLVNDHFETDNSPNSLGNMFSKYGDEIHLNIRAPFHENLISRQLAAIST